MANSRLLQYRVEVSGCWWRHLTVAEWNCLSLQYSRSMLSSAGLGLQDEDS